MLLECVFINALVEMNAKEEGSRRNEIVSCWLFDDSVAEVAKESLVGVAE